MLVGIVAVVSKFWLRSITQPFQVLWAFGVQVFDELSFMQDDLEDLLRVLPEELRQVPFLSSHVLQLSQLAELLVLPILTFLLNGTSDT